MDANGQATANVPNHRHMAAEIGQRFQFLCISYALHIALKNRHFRRIQDAPNYIVGGQLGPHSPYAPPRNTLPKKGTNQRYDQRCVRKYPYGSRSAGS